MFNKNSGGFALAEFAIALPLLILLGWGLVTVSLKIFRLGSDQIDNYVLETDARYAIERIAQCARTAKEVDVQNHAKDIYQIKFVYRVVENETSVTDVADVWRTQYFIPGGKEGIYTTLHAERQGEISGHPIIGNNYFNKTKINVLKFVELNDNVLHITLELESLNTGRKLKICTAVFMPGCGAKGGLPRE